VTGGGGEHDLARLLANLQPALDPVTYVFVTRPPGPAAPPGIEPLARFREAEGETLVVARAMAERHALPATFPCRRITLTVHSALDAVGLLAAVTQCLAAAGIPSNAISAYHHDHLFVPADRADDALAALAALGRAADGQAPTPSSAR